MDGSILVIYATWIIRACSTAFVFPCADVQFGKSLSQKCRTCRDIACLWQWPKVKCREAADQCTQHSVCTLNIFELFLFAVVSSFVILISYLWINMCQIGKNYLVRLEYAREVGYATFCDGI